MGEAVLLPEPCPSPGDAEGLCYALEGRRHDTV